MKDNRATNNPGATYSISFDPLWRTLEERKIKRSDLAANVGLSRVTIAKMGKGESVTLDVVARICSELRVPIQDVVEITTDDSIPDSAGNGSDEG